RKLILEREQFYLDKLNPVYNINMTAGSSLGYVHREESIAKISEAKKGILRTEEHKAKISLALMGENNPMFGKKGGTISEETRLKMSLAKSGKKLSTEAKYKLSKKVYLYIIDPVSNKKILLETFNSNLDTAKYFDCDKKTIYNYKDTGKLYKKKWILSSSILCTD